jgi:hypothetical protein
MGKCCSKRENQVLANLRNKHKREEVILVSSKDNSIEKLKVNKRGKTEEGPETGM